MTYIAENLKTKKQYQVTEQEKIAIEANPATARKYRFIQTTDSKPKPKAPIAEKVDKGN